MMTVDDIIGSIQLSSLPTLLVEGSDDMSLYRRMELELLGGEIDIMQCWGRANLFQVFDRRGEFPAKKVAFLADLDLNVFTGIPPGKSAIIWTTGYSIENDLLSSYDLDRLFTKLERRGFLNQLDELAAWFAFEVTEALDGRKFLIDVSPNKVVPEATGKLCPIYCKSRGYKPSLHPATDKLATNKRLMIRGKNLVRLVSRFLSSPTRQPHYSAASLLEMGIAFSKPGSPIERLAKTIRLAI